MEPHPERFAAWLNLLMERQGLSQAELARTIGVADAQVSRWRRGQVVPTVRSLQRIADTFAVPRGTLDHLAGYPTGELSGPEADDARDPLLASELRLYQVWYGQLLEQQVPHSLWRIYTEECAALARALALSWQTARHSVEEEDEHAASEPGADRPDRQVGFAPGRAIAASQLRELRKERATGSAKGDIP
ncbi:MAG: helix-turn-helix domain-containing protein [Thermomicrobiales bacterium]